MDTDTNMRSRAPGLAHSGSPGHSAGDLAHSGSPSHSAGDLAHSGSPSHSAGGPARSGSPSHPAGGPARSGSPSHSAGGPARSGSPNHPAGGPARSGSPSHPAGGPAHSGSASHPDGGPAHSGNSVHSGASYPSGRPRHPIAGPGHPPAGPRHDGPHRLVGNPLHTGGLGHPVGGPWHDGRPDYPAHHPVRGAGGSGYPVSGPARVGRPGYYLAARGRYFGGPRYHWGWGDGYRRDYGRRWRWPWLYRGISRYGLIPSPMVTWAQACLAQLFGPWVPQDGVQGPGTRQAIEQFQMQQHLPATGMLDDDTAGALQAICSGQQQASLADEIGEVDNEFGEVGTNRMVDPNKVDCAKFERSWPIFRAIGTTDPVSALEVACQRAVAMLDNTIAELTRIRERVRAGEPPAPPLISDLLGWSLQTRLLMRVSDPKAWTGTGPRTAEQILRWLTNIRNTIATRDLWYTCLASGCEGHSRRWAFVVPGKFRIHLCRRFWRAETDAATHLEFQAQTIIHEVSHIFYDTKDSGRGAGDAECISQFVADANGSPIDEEYVRVCGGRGPSAAHEISDDTSESFDGGQSYQDVEEPFPLPQWPPSRSFNPPLQTIPSRTFQTAPGCEALIEAMTRLSLDVEALKNQLRQRPSNLKNIIDLRNNVRAQSLDTIARLKDHSFVRGGCTRNDMGVAARSVDVMRGPGEDADTGSWPLADSATAQQARTEVRQSLRHLLAWLRRADRRFPGI
jgi:Putative peptidoglycan binding domain/Lysine-specific metallo-endopeptidase